MEGGRSLREMGSSMGPESRRRGVMWRVSGQQVEGQGEARVAAGPCCRSPCKQLRRAVLGGQRCAADHRAGTRRGHQVRLLGHNALLLCVHGWIRELEHS